MDGICDIHWQYEGEQCVCVSGCYYTTATATATDTYHVSCAILVLKFLCVSSLKATSVSAASTGSGVDVTVTSSVNEARNNDAAELRWKNILAWLEWAFGDRIRLFKKSKVQGYKNGRKQETDDLLTTSELSSSIEFSHHMVYLVYVHVEFTRLERSQDTRK